MFGGLSTSDAVCELTRQVKEAFRHANALDTVPHDMLLETLESYMVLDVQ